MTAREISELMLEIGARLDHSIESIQGRCQAEEFASYRVAVGRIMGEILLGVLNPLYVLHPDLRPPELQSPAELQ